MRKILALTLLISSNLLGTASADVWTYAPYGSEMAINARHWAELSNPTAEDLSKIQSDTRYERYSFVFKDYFPTYLSAEITATLESFKKRKITSTWRTVGHYPSPIEAEALEAVCQGSAQTQVFASTLPLEQEAESLQKLQKKCGSSLQVTLAIGRYPNSQDDYSMRLLKGINLQIYVNYSPSNAHVDKLNDWGNPVALWITNHFPTEPEQFWKISGLREIYFEPAMMLDAAEIAKWSKPKVPVKFRWSFGEPQESDFSAWKALDEKGALRRVLLPSSLLNGKSGPALIEKLRAWKSEMVFESGEFGIL